MDESERTAGASRFEPAFVSVRYAADELGVSIMTIYRWVKAGDIEYQRFGSRTIRIPREVIYRRKADAAVSV